MNDLNVRVPFCLSGMTIWSANRKSCGRQVPCVVRGQPRCGFLFKTHLVFPQWGIQPKWGGRRLLDWKWFSVPSCTVNTLWGLKRKETFSIMCVRTWAWCMWEHLIFANARESVWVTGMRDIPKLCAYESIWLVCERAFEYWVLISVLRVRGNPDVSGHSFIREAFTCLDCLPPLETASSLSSVHC